MRRFLTFCIPHQYVPSPDKAMHFAGRHLSISASQQTYSKGNPLERRLSHAPYVDYFLLVRSSGNWRQTPETCIKAGTSFFLEEMDVDQDLREYQRQYLDFLDDGVSTAKTKPSQNFYNFTFWLRPCGLEP